MFSKLKKLKEWLDSHLDARKMFIITSNKLLSAGTAVFVDICLKHGTVLKNLQLVDVSLRTLSVMSDPTSNKELVYMLNDIDSITIVDVIEKDSSNTLPT
jgi:hypothetical protein